MSDGDRNVFKLLVRQPEAAPADSIELGGSRWTLKDHPRIPEVENAPEFTCISYAWGRGTALNPMAPGRSMSIRTLPVLDAVITALRPASIWIDALCVPAHEPARGACLRGLGAIYTAASQVAVVLSSACSRVLRQLRDTGRVDPVLLQLLEDDEWVTRAWTYQEMVNARSVQFVAEQDRLAVDAQQFFSDVGMALEEYKKAHGVDSFTVRNRHPRVDGLVDLLGDWMTGSALARSAYQVLSAIDQRRSEQPEDRFNAVIGAIQAQADQESGLDPSERFMRACEARSDFSFIYCAAPRSSKLGRTWRPLPGPLPALFPWHTFGSGQSGRLLPDHLELDGMCRMARGSPSAPARELLEQSWGTNGSDGASAVLAKLKQAGFAGDGEVLELGGGYFFSSAPLVQSGELVVWIASGVRWAMGALGLLATAETGSEAKLRFRDVGVFVGLPPGPGESIRLT